MSDLEIIKQACIRANPELLKPCFGCKVKLEVRGDDGIILQESPYHDDSDPQWIYYNYNLQKVYIKKFTDNEILGCPITLADVLLAIRALIHTEVIEPDLSIAIDDLVNQYWDLTKPLESQSEETLNFLAKLLHE